MHTLVERISEGRAGRVCAREAAVFDGGHKIIAGDRITHSRCRAVGFPVRLQLPPNKFRNQTFSQVRLFAGLREDKDARTVIKEHGGQG